jgi:hypothetical protein
MNYQLWTKGILRIKELMILKKVIGIIVLLKVDQIVEAWSPQEEVEGEIQMKSKGKNLSRIHQ